MSPKFISDFFGADPFLFKSLHLFLKNGLGAGYFNCYERMNRAVAAATINLTKD
jgi:hypothetical protein